MPEYEQNKVTVLPEADYPFKVVNAKETTAMRSGNPMIELTLNFDGESTVTDRLVFTPAAYWRIDAFRECTGEVLGTGNVSFEAEHCIGRTGWAHLVVDEMDGRKRNQVGHYLHPSAVSKAKPGAPPPVVNAAAPQAKKKADPDDIPF